MEHLADLCLACEDGKHNICNGYADRLHCACPHEDRPETIPGTWENRIFENFRQMCNDFLAVSKKSETAFNEKVDAMLKCLNGGEK